MEGPSMRGNGLKIASSSSDRSDEKRAKKRPGHPNRDRSALKQNLAKAIAPSHGQKILPPPPVRTERLPSSESEKGWYLIYRLLDFLVQLQQTSLIKQLHIGYI